MQSRVDYWQAGTTSRTVTPDLDVLADSPGRGAMLFECDFDKSILRVFSPVFYLATPSCALSTRQEVVGLLWLLFLIQLALIETRTVMRSRSRSRSQSISNNR